MTISNLNLFNILPYEQNDVYITYSHIGSLYFEDIEMKDFINMSSIDIIKLVKKTISVFVTERISLSMVKKFAKDNLNDLCVSNTQRKTIVTKVFTGNQILKLI